jgi:hypothetical protein
VLLVIRTVQAAALWPTAQRCPFALLCATLSGKSEYKAQRAGSLVENSNQSLISPIGATLTFIDTVY